MSGHNQSKLTRDDAGYEERIRRANARTIAALETSLAQDQAVLKMGTEIHAKIRFDRKTGKQLPSEIAVDLVDAERVGYLATQLRPFQLKREAIYHEGIVEGLRRFADIPYKKTVVEQLP